MFNHRFFEGGATPSCYKVDGVVIPLNTDFRPWLRYEWLQSNRELIGREKAIACISLCCADEHILQRVAPDLVMDGLVWFHSCADVERHSQIKITPKMQEDMNSRPAMISLFWDFWQLWASFKQQYNIDLYSCGELHWWDFQRLLFYLQADTPMASMRHLRSITRADVKNTKEWDKLVLDKLFAALPHERP